MLNLIKKDYIFTKKIIAISLIYCIAVPLFLMLDNDEKMYLADYLIPLAIVTAPLSRIMSKEDTKSGLIFQKTLPYSSYEKVGARFLFVISLLVLGNVLLNVIKQIVFKTQNFGDEVIKSIPVFVGFGIYYALYMTVYYWKGYFASQFCIYALIAIIIFGQKLLSERVVEFISSITNNKVGTVLLTVIILAIFYLFSCIFEQNRRLDE